MCVSWANAQVICNISIELKDSHISTKYDSFVVVLFSSNYSVNKKCQAQDFTKITKKKVFQWQPHIYQVMCTKYDSIIKVGHLFNYISVYDG